MVNSVLTVDSSVFIAALRPTEPSHIHCRRLFEQVIEGRFEVFVPYSVLLEVVAAVFRRTGSRTFAHTVQTQLLKASSLHFVDLVKSRACQASELATKVGLRGMDALVLQVAHEMDAVLVTLDEELAETAKGLVSIRPVSSLMKSS